MHQHEEQGCEEAREDAVHSGKEIQGEPVREDEGEDRQPRVPGAILAAAADNRAGVFRYRVLQGDGPVHAAREGKSGHAMETILHSAQYREMHKAIMEETRGIRGKTGDRIGSIKGFLGKT